MDACIPYVKPFSLRPFASYIEEFNGSSERVHVVLYQKEFKLPSM